VLQHGSKLVLYVINAQFLILMKDLTAKQSIWNTQGVY